MENIYRLKVKYGCSWKVGLNTYTHEGAVRRVSELAANGISAKIVSEKELFRSDIPVVW